MTETTIGRQDGRPQGHGNTHIAVSPHPILLCFTLLSPACGQVQAAASACRLKCLDIARGCTVALMLFVNHVGKEPGWIAHAPWDGLHLADLVMPCFLLIVGISTALALTAGRQRGTATSVLLQRVLSRAGMARLQPYATSPPVLTWTLQHRLQSSRDIGIEWRHHAACCMAIRSEMENRISAFSQVFVHGSPLCI